MLKMLFYFVVVGILFAQQFSIGNACSMCAPDPRFKTPTYCRSEFLALVKLTENTQHRYRFELLKDVTNFGEVKRTSLNGFAFIDDLPGTCSFFLASKNVTYLIGGRFHQVGDVESPTLDMCNGWVEKWDFTAEQATARLAEYKSKCEPLSS